MNYTVMNYTVMSGWIRSRDIIHHSRCIFRCRFRIYTHFQSRMTIWDTWDNFFSHSLSQNTINDLGQELLYDWEIVGNLSFNR
jgi:hypothetical protein